MLPVALTGWGLSPTIRLGIVAGAIGSRPPSSALSGRQPLVGPESSAMRMRGQPDMPWPSELGVVTRRDLIRTAVAGGIGIGLGSVSSLGVPRRVWAQSTLTPDEALKRLMDGNARFVAGRLTSFQEDLTLLTQKTAEKQEPFAAVLSCADSRVP